MASLLHGTYDTRKRDRSARKTGGNMLHKARHDEAEQLFRHVIGDLAVASADLSITLRTKYEP